MVVCLSAGRGQGDLDLATSWHPLTNLLLQHHHHDGGDDGSDDHDGGGGGGCQDDILPGQSLK